MDMVLVVRIFGEVMEDCHEDSMVSGRKGLVDYELIIHVSRNLLIGA